MKFFYVYLWYYTLFVLPIIASWNESWIEKNWKYSLGYFNFPALNNEDIFYCDWNIFTHWKWHILGVFSAVNSWFEHKIIDDVICYGSYGMIMEFREMIHVYVNSITSPKGRISGHSRIQTRVFPQTQANESVFYLYNAEIYFINHLDQNVVLYLKSSLMS